MKKHLFILIFFAAIISNAQNQPLKRTCGTETPSSEWNEWFNNKVVEFKKKQCQSKRSKCKLHYSGNFSRDTWRSKCWCIS
jgi:hypothetical protein